MCVFVKLLMTPLPTLHIETVPKRVRKKRYIVIDSEESNVKFKQPSLELKSKKQNEIAVGLATELRYKFELISGLIGSLQCPLNLQMKDGK